MPVAVVSEGKGGAEGARFWDVDGHEYVDLCLGDTARPPLARVRGFFEMTQQAYAQEGYLGCLLGGLGQELSGAHEVFRRRIGSLIDTELAR